jgi:hypothetical protein
MKYISYVLSALLLLSIISCGESKEEKTERLKQDSIRRIDSLTALLKPRKDIYDAAVSLIKENLKVPSTVRIPAVKLQDDSIRIVMHTNDTAVVYGSYEAQNSFGVYLAPDKFKVLLSRSNGKWGPMDGELLKFNDVHMTYMPQYDFDRIK